MSDYARYCSPMLQHKKTSIGFGTAQWQGSYGISNSTGAPSSSEISEILKLGIDHSVAYLDTAPAYGSETIVGDLKALAGNFRIITKTAHSPEFTNPSKIRSILEKGLANSVQKLSGLPIYGLMIHQPKLLLDKELAAETWAWLVEAKEKYLISRIGVSVYSPDEALQILERFPIELIQVPFSVVDRRLSPKKSQALRNRGVEIHVRSVFLQGALLLSPETLPPHLLALSPVISLLKQKSLEAGCSPARLALQFALEQSNADGLIVGAENLAQISDLLLNSPSISLTKIGFPTEIPALSDEVVDPRLWKK